MTEKTTGAAFAPGHITGLFVPSGPADHPLGRGSLGAGLVLDRGATARVELTSATRSSLAFQTRGRPERFPVTAAALGKILSAQSQRWSVRVELDHALPVSAGLGMSAAGTLAASLALAQALGMDPKAAVEASHLAELEAHTGLGGVVAILGGGFEVRRSAGLEPWGRVERTPLDADVLLAYREEPLPSPPLLSDAAFLARVTEAGVKLLSGLPAPPLRVGVFMECSRQFTRRLDLGGEPFHTVLRRACDQGFDMAQAMLGNTLFQVRERGTGREAASLHHDFSSFFARLGFQTRLLHAGNTGAHVLESAVGTERGSEGS